MKKIVTMVAMTLGMLVFASGINSCTKAEQKVNGDILNAETNLKGKNIKEVYFAGGCFWGTEHLFQLIRGVVSTEVGYANGNTKNPTYDDVVSHTTGFAETVKVKYDADQVDLKLLVDLFFKSIDPTTMNRQGNDVGDNYRSGIFFTDKETGAAVKNEVKQLSKNYSKPVVVETTPLKNFYSAEDYHQDYLVKNPNGYCHIEPGVFEEAKNANPIKPKK